MTETRLLSDELRRQTTERIGNKFREALVFVIFRAAPLPCYCFSYDLI